ncbi:EAL domain-containing protein [Aneurinibacillus terranovensis]|uniref:EAL domain-containing protein n=1 Tax=Aneurinibacillus terranovensis TaxID=278991 RepID=UPI0004202CE8|nr:EAL domain-containing protein [Aneurinibacillus terranovensis]
MSLVNHSSLDIEKMIMEERVISYFQPLVSIKQKAIVGIEALARGVNSEGGPLISPVQLFEEATKQGVVLELDRLCRKKALEGFARLCAKNPDLILFMNFETLIIDNGIVGSGYLLNQVQETGVNPNQIVLEIIESKVSDSTALTQFVTTYRNFGFLLALDDVGAGYSNLDRIPLIKPDILKIDRSLITNIHEEYHKQEIVKSLANLSKRIGALVVAEGIETRQEACFPFDIGIDILQGYYFARPKQIGQIDRYGLHERIEGLSYQLQHYKHEQLSRYKSQKVYCDGIVKMIRNEIGSQSSACFDEILREVTSQFSAIECTYILDAKGVQISDTHCNEQRTPPQSRFIFQPALKGTDHSLKDYFYQLTIDPTIQIFNTEPYISLATGNLCLTFSCLFADDHGSKYTLCVDFNPQSTGEIEIAGDVETGL